MKYFSFIFLGVGIILLTIAAIFVLMVQGFLAHALSANGMVVDYSYTSRGSACPIIEFTAQSGQQVRYHSNICSNPPAYRPDQKARIYYDPGNLQNVQMAGAWGQYMVSIILVLIGLPFSLVGVWLFFMLRR